MSEDKNTANRMVADDLRRLKENTQPYPFWDIDQPLPPPDGDDGDGLAILFTIGARNDLSKDAAKREAEKWQRWRHRYPRALFYPALLGYDDDPRELWDIRDAARYVRRWARHAGIEDLESAIAVFVKEGVGLLAACGALGEEVRKRTRVPPPAEMQ
jgi:hypothetical protein